MNRQSGFSLPLVLVGMLLMGVLSTSYLNQSYTQSREMNVSTDKEQAMQLAQTGLDFVGNRFHAAAPANDLNNNSIADVQEAYTTLLANPTTLPLPYAYTDSRNAHKPLQVMSLLQHGIESGTGCSFTGQDVSTCSGVKPNDLFLADSAPLLFTQSGTGLEASVDNWTNTVAESKVAVFLEYTVNPATPDWMNLHLVSVAQVGKAVHVEWKYVGAYVDPANFHVATHLETGI
ncbi:MAG: hypothetical protein WA056_02310 [Gallionella sp.]